MQLVLKTLCENISAENMSRRCLVSLLLLAALLFSCSEPPREGSAMDEEQQFVEMDGVRVPVFRTAEEQLNYTRSWFAQTWAKKAALRALLHLYPENRRYCALAELDLAYLELGDDYRFASPHAAFTALKAYRNVVQHYAEFADILAKAYWYIAWIYVDLLGDELRGLQYYQQVVDTFPDEQVSLLPSAPWVSIIYPAQEESRALSSSPENFWAALALAEIIRYTKDDEIAWKSFQLLWQNYRKTKSAGVGLRLILRRRCHVDDVLGMARQFLQNDFSNVYLLDDIQGLINAEHRVDGEH